MFIGRYFISIYTLLQFIAIGLVSSFQRFYSFFGDVYTISIISHLERGDFLLFFALFVLFCITMFILFFPVLMNLFLLPLTGAGNTIQGIGILQWSICFQNITTIQLSLTGLFLLIALMLFVYTAIKKDDKILGTQFGTARWLSEDEFSKLVPHYTFHKNEFDYPHIDFYVNGETYDDLSFLEKLEVMPDEQ